MKQLILLISIFFIFATGIFGQEASVYGFYRESGVAPGEFLMLGQLNPYTGIISEQDTITQIYAYALSTSTFDQSRQYFIFKGLDTDEHMKLISRDVNNNSTVYSPLNDFTINDFQYDMNSKNLYALGNYISDSTLIDTTNGGVYMYEYATRFMSVNIENGEAVQHSQLPDIIAFPAGNSSFDANNGRYFISGFDAQNTTRLYAIDAATGLIISDAAINLGNDQYLNELEYNNEDNSLYGIYRDNNIGLLAVATVNIESGEISILAELKNAFAFTPGASVFDQMSQRFIFYYLNSSYQSHMLVYDVLTNEIVSDVEIPGSFTEIEIDNSNYAYMKYGATSNPETRPKGNQLTIYPNPAFSEFRVHCEDKISTIMIFDMTGKEIYHTSCALRNNEFVDSEQFDPGIYFVRVETENKVHTHKMIIE